VLAVSGAREHPAAAPATAVKTIKAAPALTTVPIGLDRRRIALTPGSAQ
jgi:hypothetical protein